MFPPLKDICALEITVDRRTMVSSSGASEVVPYKWNEGNLVLNDETVDILVFEGREYEH